MISEPVTSRADGSFRLPALLGHGLINARDSKNEYRPVSVHINPAKDGPPQTCNIPMGRYSSLTGTVLGPDGKPLAGAHAYGVRYPWAWVTSSTRENSYSPKPLPTASFTVTMVEPGNRRSLIFVHGEKHLAGMLVLQGKENGPLTVRLGPAGTVTGQLIDADGVPSGKVDLRIMFENKANDSVADNYPHLTTTDAQGHFRVENLVPGLRYQILIAGKAPNRTTGLVAKVTVGPSETKDLGKKQARMFK
jgi:hypothetical protein